MYVIYSFILLETFQAAWITKSYYFTHFLFFIFFWWYEIKAWIRYSSFQKHRMQIQYVCAEPLPQWLINADHHKANDWIFSSVVILVRRKTGCSGSTSCICFINFSAWVGFQNDTNYLRSALTCFILKIVLIKRNHQDLVGCLQANIRAIERATIQFDFRIFHGWDRSIRIYSKKVKIPSFQSTKNGPISV